MVYRDPNPEASEMRERGQELICYAYLICERLPVEELFRHITRKEP